MSDISEKLNKLEPLLTKVIDTTVNQAAQWGRVDEGQKVAEILGYLTAFKEEWPLLRGSLIRYNSLWETITYIPESGEVKGKVSRTLVPDPNDYVDSLYQFAEQLGRAINEMGSGADGAANGFYNALIDPRGYGILSSFKEKRVEIEAIIKKMGLVSSSIPTQVKFENRPVQYNVESLGMLTIWVHEKYLKPEILEGTTGQFYQVTETMWNLSSNVTLGIPSTGFDVNIQGGLSHVVKYLNEALPMNNASTITFKDDSIVSVRHRGIKPDNIITKQQGQAIAFLDTDQVLNYY